MQSSSKQEGVNEPSAKANETEAVNNKKDNKTVEASANGGSNNKGNSATATITEPKQEGTKVEANKGTETSSEVKGDTENSAEVLKNVAGSKHRVKGDNSDNEKPEGTDNSTLGSAVQGNSDDNKEGDNGPSVKSLINDVTKGKMTGTPKKDSEIVQNLGLSREKQAQIKTIEKQIKDTRMEIAAAQGKPPIMARIPEMEAKIKEYEEKLRKLQGGK